jgi:hypothetical protein
VEAQAATKTVNIATLEQFKISANRESLALATNPSSSVWLLYLGGLVLMLDARDSVGAWPRCIVAGCSEKLIAEFHERTIKALHQHSLAEKKTR